MWGRGYHFLQPLIIMISYKVKFICNFIEDNSSDDINKRFSQINLLVYPYFNKIYDTHTKINPIGSVHEPIGK